MNMMRRTAVILLAACLMLTACAGGKSLPSSAAPDPASTVASAASDVISAASDAISTAAEVIGKGVYDDRLIRDCPLGEGVVPPDGGEGPYEYHLPEILADTPDARAINEEISTQIGSAVETSLTAIEYDSIPPFRRIYWSSGWNGSVVSLLIQGEADASFTDCSIYNYDFESGKRLSDAQLAEHCGLTFEEAREALRRALVMQVDAPFLAASDLNTYDGSYPLARARAASRGDWGGDEMNLYINEDGTLCAAIPAPLGEMDEWHYDKVELYFPQNTVLEPVRDDFVHAKMIDGVITVTVDDTAKARDYLPDADFSKEYVAEGFWGDYDDLYIGMIGQDFYPYLFAIRTDGGIEYADLFSGIEAGKICSAGLIPGVRGLKWIESGSVTDDYGGYWTQFANTESGDAIDLAEAIDVMDWDFDQAIRGSWSAEVEHPVASGNSYHSLYSIEIAGDGSLEVIDFLPDIEISSEYFGGLHYCGTTADGKMLFSYALYTGEGPAHSGSFTLNVFDESMDLENVGGTAIFDEAVPMTSLIRAYG